MANVENIKKAIAVMERVKRYEETHNRRLLDMRYFRREIDDGLRDLYRFPKTEEGILHQCGTTCCFAGWVAVAPEFKDQGVYCDEEGFPRIIGGVVSAHEIIAQLLEIPLSVSAKLIYGDDFYHEDNVTKKCMSEITIDDVIERLISFL